MKISVTALMAILALASCCSIALAEEKAPNDVLTVYYFHGSRRCASCRKIEKYTEEAVKEYFQDELESGDMIYNPVNTDKDENRHYIEDYSLYTKSVILSLSRKGKEIRSRNLTKVWQYLRNREKFLEYVREEIESFLEEPAVEKSGS